MELSLYDTTYEVEDTHWWFAGRRLIVFDVVRSVVDSLGVRCPRVLDLGCGTGRNLTELVSLSKAVGLDVERHALDFCRKRVGQGLVQGRAEELPFRERVFDVVMALDLLEHLDDDVQGAREIYRVLRHGGRLIAFVPAYEWLWGPQDDVSHHRRRYTPQRLKRVLREAGFRIDRVTHANTLLLPLILLGRLWLRKRRKKVATENTLHPGWSNEILKTIFSFERYLLRTVDLPLGVSLLCTATREQ